jgi:ApaG protein
MYTKTTNSIRVTVLPRYLDEQSDPGAARYFWAYTIQLENCGDKTVQLLNRYWHITDGFGRKHEVRGPGVIGQQPVLKPGDRFEYTSSVPLNTPSGMMFGEYQMVLPDGSEIQVAVPAFSLDCPWNPKAMVN